MTLGKKLQLLRKARGISQEQLAETLGVSRQAVSKWELDATLPDTGNIIALGKMFGVTTDYLLIEEAEAAAQEKHMHETPRRRLSAKEIIGIIMAAFGAVGWFVIYIVSRFVEVMVPYTYRDEYGNVWTEYSSSRIGVHFGRFVDEYHLKGLLIGLAVILAAGVVIALWDRYSIGGKLKKVYDKMK